MLRAEIATDREALATVMKRFQIPESGIRQATAWFAGKMTELKLWTDGSGRGPLHLFESLEALSLGLEGQKGLWKAMAVAAKDEPAYRSQIMKR